VIIYDKIVKNTATSSINPLIINKVAKLKLIQNHATQHFEADSSMHFISRQIGSLFGWRY